MNENTARHVEGVANLAIISKWLQPNAPLGFQRREIMELSAELQAAIEKTAALLRQVNGKVADLRASVRSEYRKDVAIPIRETFDAEMKHQLNGGDPIPGSFAAAMAASQPRRLNLADKLAVALEQIDTMALEQRAASIRPALACVPTKPTAEPGPLTDEPDELETDEETLWA